MAGKHAVPIINKTLFSSASGANGNGFGALLAFDLDGSLRGTLRTIALPIRRCPRSNLTNRQLTRGVNERKARKRHEAPGKPSPHTPDVARLCLGWRIPQLKESPLSVKIPAREPST